MNNFFRVLLACSLVLTFASAYSQTTPEAVGTAVSSSQKYEIPAQRLTKVRANAKQANLKPLGTPGNICYIGPCDGGTREECVYGDDGYCSVCYDDPSPVCGAVSNDKLKSLKPFLNKK